MRDIAFTLFALSMVPVAFWLPHVGVLLWSWVAFMAPHRLTWGFATELQLNMIFALATLVAWVMSREPKRLPIHPTSILVMAFSVWITVTTLFALNPDMAWHLWDRAIKTMLLVLVVMALMQNRTRVQAMVWVMALSLGYYGAKGGGFAILSGGNYTVLGPRYSVISDNNHLALALVMMLPILNYLRLHTVNALARLAVLATMGLTLLAVVASYSRGGLLALGVMLVFLFMRSRQKILLVALIPALLAGAYMMLPEQWFERVETIQDYETDASFQGRVDAWTFAYNVAVARPITSGGFGSTYDRYYFDLYNPGKASRAAHSIYFEVLGEHGFIGLGLFLMIGAVGWWNASWIRWNTRNRPDLLWAYDFASMVQVSMVGYFVAGGLLTMAYYDVYWTMIALLANVSLIVQRDLSPARRWAPVVPRGIEPQPQPAGATLSHRRTAEPRGGTVRQS